MRALLFFEGGKICSVDPSGGTIVRCPRLFLLEVYMGCCCLYEWNFYVM